MNEQEAREKAIEAAADDLFTSGAGNKAKRLVMEIGDHLNGPGFSKPVIKDKLEAVYQAGWNARGNATEPVDMLIFCPNCGKQHVDKPDPNSNCVHCGEDFQMHDHDCSGAFSTCRKPLFTNSDYHQTYQAWDNPPHKSHTCRTDDGGCGKIFRIADFPTNGVEAITTVGKDDTWTPYQQHGGQDD